jgi:hypothetical protein
VREMESMREGAFLEEKKKRERERESSEGEGDF